MRDPHRWEIVATVTTVHLQKGKEIFWCFACGAIKREDGTIELPTIVGSSQLECRT